MAYPCIGADDCHVQVPREGGLCAKHRAEDLAREQGYGPQQPEELIPRDRLPRIPDMKMLLARSRRTLAEQLARVEKETNKTTRTGAVPPPSRGLVSLSVELTNSIARLAQETRQWEASERAKGENLSHEEQVEIAILMLCSDQTPEELRRRAIAEISASLGVSHLASVAKESA